MWLSTRQFSSVLLPQVRLVVVDLGVPGEWPFFWQRFSQRTLVGLVQAFCQARGVPCRIGASIPTLSLLDATGNLRPTSGKAVVTPDRSASPVFVVRSSPGGSSVEPRPGIVLPETMKLLRHTFEQHLPSLVLLNLRGYATLIECAECGLVADQMVRMTGIRPSTSYKEPVLVNLVELALLTAAGRCPKP